MKKNNQGKRAIALLPIGIFLLIFLTPVENIYKNGYLVSSAGLSTVFTFLISFILIFIDVILVAVSIKHVKRDKN